MVLIPALAFVGWQIYIDARFGTNVLKSSPGLRPPFANVVDEVRRSLHQDSPAGAAWDIAYLLGLIFILLLLGDEWGDSRFGAPLFITLLLAGLEQRDRLALRICVLAAALTALIPVALGGG